MHLVVLEILFRSLRIIFLYPFGATVSKTLPECAERL